MKKRRRCAGVSLVETLTALAILLGLQALAWPSMADMLASLRLRSGAEALMSALNLTRSDAVQRNGRVVLCKSPTGLVCTDRGDWQVGWMVFQDFNNNGARDVSEPLIYRQEPLPAGLRISGNETVETFVSYTPYGYARLLRGGFQAGTFSICSTQAGRGAGFVVKIASSGRARMAKATEKECG